MPGSRSRHVLWSLLVAAGLAVFWLLLVPWALGLAAGRSYIPWDTAGVFGAQVLICTAPLLLLALLCLLRPLAARGVDRALWAGIVATSLAWGYFYGAVVVSRLAGDAGGADIGLGLLMMASPFVVALAMLVAYRAAPRDASASS